MAKRSTLGDILNPSAGTQLDCGLFSGGVFKPECWAYVFGSKTAADLANPDLAYPQPPAPVPPPAPDESLWTVAPASGSSAEATIDDLIGQASDATKAQNLNFFSRVAAENTAPSGSGSLTKWLLLGAAGLAAVFILTRRS
jgi:hypothetical protein